MNYLSVEKISKSYGERVLFEDVSFGIDKGQKVALVAKNGSGKTSLLNILVGKDVPNSGNIVWRNGINVGFLNQKDISQSKSIKSFFFSDPKYDVMKEYDRLLNSDPESEAFQNVIEEMNKLGAWDIEQEAAKILSVFGLEDLTKDTGFMSGGELKRLSLAKVLFEKPDVLILDEPTNHLDLDMIEWLEEYLSGNNITLFMVTHDRYFLDHVCDEIIELEEKQIFKYKGNFSYYLEKREERLANTQQEIDRANNLFRKELDWIRRQPKARGTKAKSRVDAFQDLKKVATQKIDEDKLTLSVKSQRMGTKILEFHNVSKTFGDKKILNKFNYVFKRYEKIGIVGKNGVGKTSFINLILNDMTPDQGKIVVGDTISFGYYEQKGLKFKEGKKVIEVVKDIAEYIPLEKGKTITALQLLERFFFSKETHYQLVDKLSGGEKKRLYLLTILMKNPNFLILDEPTNDLDIFTISALEEFLEQFTGCVITVSHDRYFLDKICDHIFYFKGEGKVKPINGNYFAYRQEVLDQQKKEAKETSLEDKERKKSNKASYEQRKEYNKLEKEIEKLESKKTELESQLNNYLNDHEQLTKRSKEIEEIINKIDTKTERWMELAELVD